MCGVQASDEDEGEMVDAAEAAEEEPVPVVDQVPAPVEVTPPAP